MSDPPRPDPLRLSDRHVSLADQEASMHVVGNAMLSLWSAVNQLTRLHPQEKLEFNVSVFGSARVTPDSIVYQEVHRLAAGLARMGCGIITGGGPGLMQAANKGAMAAGREAASIGIRIDLDFEPEPNPFVTEVFEHGTFFTRLHQFVLQSSAFIAVPGGIGTALELFMVWQLLQVKHITDVPLILVGRMWPGLIDWTEEWMLDAPTPMVSPEDVRIPICVDTVEEALAVVQPHYDRWDAARS